VEHLESPTAVIDEFIRPAVRAVPRSITRCLMRCEITLPGELDHGEAASRWTMTDQVLEIAVATRGVEPHDLALELLRCVGQALWEVVNPAMQRAWVDLLCRELAEAVPGEIDEDALDAKRGLLSSRSVAGSRRRWEAYASASFAGAIAEYTHCLWHDVTVRTGVEHLPARFLRRRLERLAGWFPPNRGYRLFPLPFKTSLS
jgi:hypothetical protein